VLLHGLDQRIGHEAFQKLLATLVARDVRTTADFSATLTALTSKDVAAAFEESLRQARPRAQ
jgi:precorrin isomerase